MNLCINTIDNIDSINISKQRRSHLAILTQIPKLFATNPQDANQTGSLKS